MSDDEVTKPSVMPEQPKTQQLPAVSPIEVAIAKLQPCNAQQVAAMRVELDGERVGVHGRRGRCRHRILGQSSLCTL